ncbi:MULTISPECIES: hypothetical protein [unclassified Streptomyces]|uniref:hypothetical protein n=1 Tax=unclassified Streptomyces TaxID=2593676 RepID=UPI003822B1DE
MAFSENFVQDVQIGLSEVLRERKLAVADYERLTDIEFPDPDTLYECLREIYAYLFEGLSQQPSPPEWAGGGQDRHVRQPPSEPGELDPRAGLAPGGDRRVPRGRFNTPLTQ